MTMMGTCNLLNSTTTTTSRSGSTSLNASTTVPKSTKFDWSLPNQETTLANDDSEENVGHIEQILSGMHTLGIFYDKFQNYTELVHFKGSKIRAKWVFVSK